MKKIGLLIALMSIFCAFSPDLQKRIVRDGEFDIECYIYPKKDVSLNGKKTYYWFKSGRVHQSKSGIGGSVLHDSYTKYYRSKQLAEKGTFKKGLKIGIWKNWHENGNLKTREVWKNGFLDGVYTLYNSDGTLAESGKYRNNRKVGRWINFVTQDTTYHKKDSVFTEKPLNLVQRILRKRDSLEKVKIKHERIKKRKTDSVQKVKSKLERKIKKRNDSIHRAKKKQERKNQKRLDSIERANTPKKKLFYEII